MRRKSLSNAKFVITVESNKRGGKIKTISIFDNRTQQYRSEYIKERGIEWFLNMADMKETLNWNLNGDESKYQFQWGMTVNGVSEGKAYIFD
jgi:hypothetical protein